MIQLRLILDILKYDSGRRISKISKHTVNATKLLNALRKNGTLIGYTKTALVIETIPGAWYYVDCKNFPDEDLTYIYVKHNGKYLNLTSNECPSLWTRIRFWLWISKTINPYKFIHFVDQNNSFSYGYTAFLNATQGDMNDFSLQRIKFLG